MKFRTLFPRALAAQLAEWEEVKSFLESQVEVLTDEKVLLLPELPIYASTDLDVLDPKEMYVETTGFAGSMKMKTLKEIHSQLFQINRVRCADIVGLPNSQNRDYNKGQKFVTFLKSLS